jgi:hypothetical protein
MKTRISKPVALLGAIAVVAIVAFGVWAVATNLGMQARSATIVQVAGTVLYCPAQDSEWVTAQVGMPLRRGDQLLTLPPNGVAVVQLDDGSVSFSLDPDTLVTLTASWDPLREVGQGGVHLDHGSLMAITRQGLPKALTHFAVDTQAAEVMIESTQLIVQALSHEPTTRVSSLKGRVSVRAKLPGAALYWPDTQKLTARNVVLDSSQTILVYVEPEPTATAMLGGNLGRVVDATGQQGQAGVVVQVLGNPALFDVTDDDGYFAIADAPAHSELLIAGATDEVERALELRTDVARVTGRLVDGTSGEVVDQARVTPMGLPELAVQTGPDGTFVFDELPVGTHSLTVVAPRYIDTAAEVTIDTEVHVALPGILIWLADVEPPVRLPLILKNYYQYP